MIERLADEALFSEVGKPPLDESMDVVRLIVAERFVVDHGESDTLRVVADDTHVRRQVGYFFTCRHFNDPDDPQFELMPLLYGEFIENSDERRKSLPEGARPFEEGSTFESAVVGWGDPGQHVYLVYANDVECAYTDETEPPYEVEVPRMVQAADELLQLPEYAALQGVTADELAAYFYDMRYARQYVSAKMAGALTGSYATYIGERISRRARLAMFPNLSVPVERLETIHAALYPGTSFDPTTLLADGSARDAEYYEDMYFPHGKGLSEDDLTVVQKLARECNHIRDVHFVSLYRKYWDAGYNIFDTHGSSHGSVLEKVLARALGIENVKAYVGLAAIREHFALDVLDIAA